MDYRYRQTLQNYSVELAEVFADSSAEVPVDIHSADNSAVEPVDSSAVELAGNYSEVPADNSVVVLADIHYCQDYQIFSENPDPRYVADMNEAYAEQQGWVTDEDLEE